MNIWTQWSDLTLPAGMTHLATDGFVPAASQFDEIEFYVPSYMGGLKTIEIIPRMKNLKVVHYNQAGYEDILPHIPQGVILCNGTGVHDVSTSELAVGLTIASRRGFAEFMDNQKNGIWQRRRKPALADSHVGIIGYGNIGSQVSVLAEAIGMKVMFYDTETKLPLGNAVPAKNLKELLTASDIVSLHVPETPQTKNLINKTNLKYFKKGAILLNYARGEVVDLKALAEAIKDGLIGGAGIDVFPVEPEKNGDAFSTPLQGLPNVILTPHIGGSTEEAQQNIGEDVSIKLFQYLERGITNGSHSVPSIALPPVEGAHRILHMHNNVPGVLSAINTALSKNNINIVGQYLKTNEEIGYVVLDVDTKLSKRALELLKEVKETIKVRMLY